jgi:hypothetical protein
MARKWGPERELGGRTMSASGIAGGYLRDRSDGRVEVHILLSDPPPSRGRRARVVRDTMMGGGSPHDPDLDADAGAGAPGELPPGMAPPGAPSDPEELTGGDGERAPTSGGLPEVRRGQTAEPELFVDARSLRIAGRDQNGRMWQSAVYGSSNPQSQPWSSSRIGDSRGGLCYSYETDHMQQLGRLQRAMTEFWSARR